MWCLELEQPFWDHETTNQIAKTTNQKIEWDWVFDDIEPLHGRWTAWFSHRLWENHSTYWCPSAKGHRNIPVVQQSWVCWYLFQKEDCIHGKLWGISEEGLGKGLQRIWAVSGDLEKVWEITIFLQFACCQKEGQSYGWAFSWFLSRRWEEWSGSVLQPSLALLQGMYSPFYSWHTLLLLCSDTIPRSHGCDPVQCWCSTKPSLCNGAAPSWELSEAAVCILTLFA